MLTEKPNKSGQQIIDDGTANRCKNNPYVCVGGQSLVELYERGQQSLHVHFLAGRVRRSDPGDSGVGYCAVIARSWEAVYLGARRIGNHVPTHSACDSERNPPMLVRVGQLLQDTQGVKRFYPLGCIVRLYSLDFCCSLWGHPVEPVTFNGGILEAFAGGAYGELVTIFGTIPFGNNKLPYKVIQGTSETVDAIADYERDIWRDGNLDLESLGNTPRLWVCLESQFAHVGVHIPSNLGIQHLQMLICPINFLANRSK